MRDDSYGSRRHQSLAVLCGTHRVRARSRTPVKRRYISTDRVIISPVGTVAELSLNVANRQDRGGTFAGLIGRGERWGKKLT